MKKSQAGFTLIELVVVIVLLGILGVTALGKFQDLSKDARDAANSGVAAELTSAAAINYATFLVNGGGEIVGAAADGCAPADLVVLFQSGAFPTGMTSSTPVPASACATSATNGATFTCQIRDTGSIGDAATATLICAQ